MDNNTSFTIEVGDGRDRLDTYIRLITLGEITRREHELLVHIVKVGKEIGRPEKAAIRGAMGISQYHLNNLLGSLRSKGFVRKDSETKKYSFAFSLPDDPMFEGMPRMVFEFTNK